MITSQLLQKYNVPVPRYTSYPTVPVWKDDIDVKKLSDTLAHQFKLENKKNGIETVTPMKDKDGEWRVSGYFVK